MVAVRTSWFSRIRLGGGRDDTILPDDNPGSLGILAFEAARTMCRLVSLHRALSDAEISRLLSDVARDEGVAYLNSADQDFLLRLACAEMADDLDRAAEAVARLGRRCLGVWPRGFEHVYDDLKSGFGDIHRLGLGVHPKDIERKVRKMERYVSSTRELYLEMGVLAEMEEAERRSQVKSGQHGGGGGHEAFVDPTLGLFHKRMTWQRNRVRHLREESLWVKSFDKAAELMARCAVTVFARICTVFGPLVAELPPVATDRRGRLGFALQCRSRLCPHHHHHLPGGLYTSGPLERSVVGNPIIRNSGPILRPQVKTTAEAKPWKIRLLEPPPHTVGATGMALRYAEVIVLLEKLAGSPELVGEKQKVELYRMLPAGLRNAVRAKLRNCPWMDSGMPDDELLAGGWAEAVRDILGWLAPMAHDTVRWHSDRSVEQRPLDERGPPRALGMQTLFFSDRVKTDAAMVEVLVGLSCVCRYQQSGDAESSVF